VRYREYKIQLRTLTAWERGGVGGGESAEGAPDSISRFSPACCAGKIRRPPPVPQRHRLQSLEARTRRACAAAERCFARSRPMD
jgi:hypothetical protein